MRKLLIATVFLLVFTVTTRAQNTIFVPNCGGVNDTARIQRLIDLIEDNTGTIRLPYKDSTRCAVNSITFPENITLDNSDGTGLWRNTGAVVTVLGPIVNPIGKPLFYGPGTTNLTGNTHVGTNGQALLSDGAGGTFYGDVTGGGGGSGVSTFKGRTGAVLPAANDYSAEQLSNGTTGSGPVVLQNTPTINGLLAPTINGLTITPSNGTLTIANNKSLTVSNSIALVAAADGFTFTIPGSGTAVLTTRTITEGAGLAGNTYDLSANRTLAMGTPSSLSVSSNNSVAGSTHSHAVAASANPGPAASLLASDAQGRLQLTGLGIGIAGTEPLEVAGNIFVNSPTANLFLKDTGTGLQSSATGIVSLQAGNCLRSTNFTSGLVGLNICSNGNAEFDNVDVRGAIHAGLIVFNAQMATAGTLGVFKSAAKLRTDFTVPTAPTYGTTTVQIEAVDQDGLTHAASQLFAVGDILRVKDGLVGDTWFEVTAASDQTTFWRYTARIWAGTNNATYRAGLGIADYGAAGQGFIIQTADQTNAPYLQMATHTHSFTSASSTGTLDVTPRLRLGNLNGSYGYNADTYGFATGPYGSAGQTWISVEPTNGIRIGNNTTTIAQWATSGAITVGQVAVGQSNINISAGQILLRNNTTTRIQLNTDGSGFLANSLISWDASGNLSVTGNANIAGWSIDTNRMSNGTTYIASNFDPPSAPFAWFGKSAAGYRGTWLADASNRFLALLTDGGLSPRLVLNDGVRYRQVIGDLNNAWGSDGATNSMGMKIWNSAGNKLVEFSDSLNVIANWVITTNRIASGAGTVGLDAVDTGADDVRIFAGNSTPTSAPFRVTESGALTATNATITGAITATSGTFAGSLSSATGTFAGSLSAATGTFTGSLTAATGTFAGSLSAATGTFAGSLSAASGTFAGSLSAASGTFTGDLTGSNMALTGKLTMSGTSSAITIGASPPTSASAGDGIWIDRTGLYGLASSVLQTKIDATGKLVAAGGGIVLDATGQTFTQTSTATLLKFIDGGNTSLEIGGFNGDSIIRAHGAASGGIAPDGRLLLVTNDNANTSGLNMNLTGGSTQGVSIWPTGSNTNFKGLNVCSNTAGCAFTASSALEVNSTTGAFLPPRMTSTQRDALTAVDGMMIYNTTTGKFQGRAAGAWVDFH